MMQAQEPSVKQKLSDIIEEVFAEDSGPRSFGSLIDQLDHHGMAIVLILFSLPSALPVPAPGYSTVLSVPLMLIGVRLLLGKNTVWLPKNFRDKTFDPSGFAKLKRAMLKLTRFIERFSKPRLLPLVHSRLTYRTLGLLVCALACFMAIPIPGTNSLPAGGIFLIGFGLLEDDGLLLVLGVLYSCIAVVTASLILIFGAKIVKGFVTQLLS